MSRLYGPIFQVAYVVEDVDAAIAHWTRTMGVGPFTRFPLPLAADWLEVGGARVDPATADLMRAVALSYSGETMIELIEPGAAPSPYRAFLDSGRRGAHHLGTFATDYDAQLAAARAAGIGVAMEGVLPLSRFAYLETDALWPGTMIEIIDATPEMHAFFADIRAAARAWDGRQAERAP